jgi:hypothetical protein
VLIAAIFSSDSGPDSKTGLAVVLSGKNSARFSRISADFGVGNSMVWEVSDGEMEWNKGIFSGVSKLEIRSQNSPSFPPDHVTHPAKKGGYCKPAKLQGQNPRKSTQ